MAVIGLCTGTTQDWQDTVGKLILIERELGVEITDDGYYLIRMGNGKDDFFDLPIIVNNKRYEEILKLIEGYDSDASLILKNVTDLADKAQKSATDSKTSADNAKTYADNAKASADDSKNSADNSEASAIASKNSADNSEVSANKSNASATDAANTLNAINEIAESVIKKVTGTNFRVNYDTGELEYLDDTVHDFRINEETGELEWRVV